MEFLVGLVAILAVGFFIWLCMLEDRVSKLENGITPPRPAAVPTSTTPPLGTVSGRCDTCQAMGVGRWHYDNIDQPRRWLCEACFKKWQDRQAENAIVPRQGPTVYTPTTQRVQSVGLTTPGSADPPKGGSGVLPGGTK